METTEFVKLTTLEDVLDSIENALAQWDVLISERHDCTDYLGITGDLVARCDYLSISMHAELGQAVIGLIQAHQSILRALESMAAEWRF